MSNTDDYLMIDFVNIYCIDHDLSEDFAIQNIQSSCDWCII